PHDRSEVARILDCLSEEYETRAGGKKIVEGFFGPPDQEEHSLIPRSGDDRLENAGRGTDQGNAEAQEIPLHRAALRGSVKRRRDPGLLQGRPRGKGLLREVDPPCEVESLPLPQIPVAVEGPQHPDRSVLRAPHDLPRRRIGYSHDDESIKAPGA